MTLFLSLLFDPKVALSSSQCCLEFEELVDDKIVCIYSFKSSTGSNSCWPAASHSHKAEWNKHTTRHFYTHLSQLKRTMWFVMSHICYHADESPYSWMVCFTFAYLPKLNRSTSCHAQNSIFIRHSKALVLPQLQGRWLLFVFSEKAYLLDTLVHGEIARTCV